MSGSAGVPGAGPARPPVALVVGVGNPDRGDDAAGHLVAAAVRALDLPGVAVTVLEDPMALLDAWAGHGLVVVVDAVRSGADPGAVHVLETGAGDRPLPAVAWTGAGRGGTHALGLGTAVELARALGRLPARLVVVGVEAGSADHGAAPTPAVEAAVGPAVDQVRRALDRRARPGVRAGEGVATDVPG